jgi:hypothetical protein
MEWLDLGQELHGGCRLCISKKLRSWLRDVCLIRWKKAGGKPFIARSNFFSKEGHIAVGTGGTHIFTRKMMLDDESIDELNENNEFVG